MLAAMVERVFLGWDRPFLDKAATWLLARSDELPRMLLVVPTAQGGRRLREAMVEKAGALLTPRIITPGALLKTPDADIAPDWMERVAWLETLEGITDWTPYQDLFPEPPAGIGDWAGGLAGEMVALRHALQENGLTLAAASKVLSASVEAERWAALALLEQQVERTLAGWGFRSRSRVLAAGLNIPDGFTRMVLAGVTEMPPLVERALRAWNGPVTVLLGAPEEEAETFSTLGKPLPCWSERTLSWPAGEQGSVRLVADARQQATEALRAVSEIGTASHDVALGSTDTETGDEIARVFTRAGWTAFHPAAMVVNGGLPRWFKIWKQWLADPKLSILTDLLALPETGVLTGGRRAQKAECLCQLRNDWMVLRPEDLRHRMKGAAFRTENRRDAAEELLKTVDIMERWRADFLGPDFQRAADNLLERIAGVLPETADHANQISQWFSEAAPLMRRVNRSSGFWIELMLGSLTPATPQPPEDRVIDVQGWLELFFEPGSHLVLCGMNEGKVPAAGGADPWLGENAGKQLGLITQPDRAARDAFLYQALLEARAVGGRADVICAKSGNGGESLLPSRLLLAADRADLPERVQFLFRGVEPPEAGLRWHADWQWKPRKLDVSKRINATSLTTYLACPFRFYLKHVLHMQATEPGRVEWSARDFGNVAHEILERWGGDSEAREETRPGAIHRWLSGELDRIVTEWFGKAVPLAVRVQAEVLRQRFLWFARVQAQSRETGWEIIEVEHKFEIPVGAAVVVAKIDRIDRHREDGQLRVIDYKTGKVDAVDKSHRRKLGANSVLPPHLTGDCPAIYSGSSKGKSADFQWTNLQLPLYSLALAGRTDTPPLPCYFTLGATEADVDIHEWTDFSADDLQAAKTCVGWLVEQISSGIFWPPAEKIPYDDYAVLGAGRKLEEMFSPVPAD